MKVTPSSSPPDLAFENELSKSWRVSFIAGIDEAGRGALAGPVVAAAVILPLNDFHLFDDLQGVTDSKLLTASARERHFPRICQRAITYGIGFVSAAVIDSIGILPATRQAMAIAIHQLSPKAQALLIDGRIRLAQVNLPQQDIVRGDQRSLSVAAASILAKVSRDQYMIELDECFPDYGFSAHKGYGTVEHRQVLNRLGPCPEHRRSFAPLRVTLL